MAPLNNTNDMKNAVVRSTGSSGSSERCCHLVVDEKKRKRMESNRESARRSRQRKQQHLDDLLKQVGNLTRENEEIGKRIGEISGIFANFEAQNKVLQAQKDKLAATLESLESVIEIAKVVRGSSSSSGNNDGESLMYDDNSDPMMKPWQLPCPSLPIIASTNLNGFKFR